MSDISIRAPKHKCLKCGAELSGMTAADWSGSRPRPGDYCICFYCGHAMVVADDGTARRPTPKERRRMLQDPQLMHVVGVIERRIRQRMAQNN